MNDIIIYESEKSDGISEQIRTQASVAYASQMLAARDLTESSVLSEALTSNASDFLASAGRDDDDIYHSYSILVTTSWNKNDDVFPNSEVWAARNTPKYKPANLEHDEKRIVGGIIGSWPVDKEFNLIDTASSVDDLPDSYHILVSSVIYRQWQDQEYKARAEELIRKIEEGNMYVSMECIFRGFDYAIQTPDMQNHIIARNEETAFLSRHLRAYGGTGEYEGHKVGRLLKNITFSGKGFVERPANPDSIIFDKDQVFDFAGASVSKNLFSSDNGVSVMIEQSILSNTDSESEEENSMSDFLNDQVKELKEALAASQDVIQELTDKVSKANVEKLEVEITELNQSVSTLSDSIVEAEAKSTEDAEKIEALEASVSELTAAKEAAESAIAQMEKEKKRQARAAALIEAGISEEEVEAKLETFASLSEEQFNDVVSIIAGLNEAVTGESESEANSTDTDIQDEVDTSETQDAAEAEAEADLEETDEEVLETASIEEEADLSVASEEEEANPVEQTRAGLREWVDSYVFNQTKVKGDI
jgi:hypothetical protein